MPKEAAYDLSSQPLIRACVLVKFCTLVLALPCSNSCFPFAFCLLPSYAPSCSIRVLDITHVMALVRV